MKQDGGLFMTILALEFSTLQRSVAVTGGGRVSEAVDAGTGGNHAFGMIERALAEAKIEREQVDILAVGLGPGSYTGIRAAISIAQGWQLACGVKLCGISSVEAIVAQARAENFFGRVTVVIDAQRNELYLATYDITSDGLRETLPLKILSRAEAQSRENNGEIFIGPEVTKWFPGGRTIFPRAAMLAELAVRRNTFTPGEKLEPVYLRETTFTKSPPRLPVL